MNENLNTSYIEFIFNSTVVQVAHSKKSKPVEISKAARGLGSNQKAKEHLPSNFDTAVAGHLQAPCFGWGPGGSARGLED